MAELNHLFDSFIHIVARTIHTEALEIKQADWDSDISEQQRLYLYGIPMSIGG